MVTHLWPVIIGDPSHMVDQPVLVATLHDNLSNKCSDRSIKNVTSPCLFRALRPTERPTNQPADGYEGSWGSCTSNKSCIYFDKTSEWKSMNNFYDIGKYGQIEFIICTRKWFLSPGNWGLKRDKYEPTKCFDRAYWKCLLCSLLVSLGPLPGI